MSKGRRVKRSGWKHPVNVNRTRRRWKLKLRGNQPATARRVWLIGARQHDLDQDMREARLM